jgi:hypothetical protein
MTANFGDAVLHLPIIHENLYRFRVLFTGISSTTYDLPLSLGEAHKAYRSDTP